MIEYHDAVVAALRGDGSNGRVYHANYLVWFEVGRVD